MRSQRCARPLFALALVSALVQALAACGSTTTSTRGTAAAASTAKLPSRTRATLILDYLPNGVHAGIYRAVQAGYYAADNIDLRIIPPTSTADTLKLIDANKADFGIADGVDVAGQIDQGRDAKAVMALVQRPLGGVITRAQDGITDARRLEGRKVGITGVPSDSAILDTVVRNAGGDPAKVKKITLGFNGVQNLENGTVAGFLGYYPADGVQLELDGTPTRTFSFDQNGGPRYPGLVVFSTRQHITSDGPLMRAFVDATVRGYRDTISKPASGLSALLAQNPALKQRITAAQLRAYGPLFQAGAPAYGKISEPEVQQLSAFLVKEKLITQPIAPARFGTNEFVPAR